MNNGNPPSTAATTPSNATLVEIRQAIRELRATSRTIDMLDDNALRATASPASLKAYDTARIAAQRHHAIAANKLNQLIGIVEITAQVERAARENEFQVPGPKRHTMQPDRLRPHSELFRTESGEIIEVE